MSGELPEDCSFCGRESTGPCQCCKVCGCVNTPCACDYDLSTPEGRRDFEKYGEAFVQIRVEPERQILPGVYVSPAPCLSSRWFEARIDSTPERPVWTQESCGLDFDHEGPHHSANGFFWETGQVTPGQMPRAHTVSRKKCSLLSIVRVFFGGRRHTSRPEAGAKTGRAG